MANWYPGLGDFVEWAKEESYLSYFKNSPDKQAIAIRLSIQEQTGAMSSYSKEIVASNQQIRSAIEQGFDKLYNINKTGFNNITGAIESMHSAIESMHSSMDYHFGVLTQQMELQNSQLSSIISILSEPFGTQVNELYRAGCQALLEGRLLDAEELFEQTFDLPTGKYYFPSYYYLGRLYLNKEGAKFNLTNPEKATKLLLEANKYAEARYTNDENFKWTLADCKFFLSQSYYFQLQGQELASNAQEELLDSAIIYCDEAVELNPNLSQGWYHLAKYYAYWGEVDIFLDYLEEAIKIDRNYSISVYDDGVFENYTSEIDNRLNQMRIAKKRIVEPVLLKAKSYIIELQQKKITHSLQLQDEFSHLHSIVIRAENDFNTQTYLGIDDCQAKLELV